MKVLFHVFRTDSVVTWKTYDHYASKCIKVLQVATGVQVWTENNNRYGCWRESYISGVCVALLSVYIHPGSKRIVRRFVYTQSLRTKPRWTNITFPRISSHSIMWRHIKHVKTNWPLRTYSKKLLFITTHSGCACWNDNKRHISKNREEC